MVKIFKYNQFINEKYEDKPEFRIKSFFDELEKNIRDWFENGTLGASGSELGAISRSLTKSIDKNLIIEFTDKNYYYQIYIIISLKNVNEEQLDNCYVKVKKYDMSSMNLLRSLGEDVSIKELNEDKIIELFSKLDDKSNTIEVSDNEVIVSEDESDLEDTTLI